MSFWSDRLIRLNQTNIVSAEVHVGTFFVQHTQAKNKHGTKKTRCISSNDSLGFWCQINWTPFCLVFRVQFGRSCQADLPIFCCKYFTWCHPQIQAVFSIRKSPVKFRKRKGYRRMMKYCEFIIYVLYIGIMRLILLYLDSPQGSSSKWRLIGIPDTKHVIITCNHKKINHSCRYIEPYIDPNGLARLPRYFRPISDFNQQQLHQHPWLQRGILTLYMFFVDAIGPKATNLPILSNYLSALSYRRCALSWRECPPGKATCILSFKKKTPEI